MSFSAIESLCDHMLSLAKQFVVIDVNDLQATDDRLLDFIYTWKLSNCEYIAKRHEFHSFELAHKDLEDHNFPIMWLVDGVSNLARTAHDVHTGFVESGDIPSRWSFRFVRTVRRVPPPEIATDFVYGIAFGFSNETDALRAKMYL